MPGVYMSTCLKTEGGKKDKKEKKKKRWGWPDADVEICDVLFLSSSVGRGVLATDKLGTSKFGTQNSHLLREGVGVAGVVVGGGGLWGRALGRVLYRLPPQQNYAFGTTGKAA